METTPQRTLSGRASLSECPRSFLDSIPSPIAPAAPGSLGYVVTKEHVEEMRRMEKICEAHEERLHREYKPVFLPVDDYLSKEINCELINADIRSYPWKTTPFGDVYYSPRYNDDRYTYRHVLLTNGVRKEAERVAATVPGGLLTEEVFVHYLGIVMSSGWSHFMLFNKQFKELILRRPKEPDAPASGEDATRIRNGAPGPNDEVDSDSGDDAEQREAIAAVRAKKARMQQEEQKQQQQHRADMDPDLTSSSGDGPSNARKPTAIFGVSAAAAAPEREAKNAAPPPSVQAEGERPTEAASSDAADAGDEKPQQAVCADEEGSSNSKELAGGSLHAAAQGSAAPVQGATTKLTAAVQATRRRRLPLSRGALQPQSTSAPGALQPRGTAESTSEAGERCRGRAAIRRREAVAPPRAAAAGRSHPSEASGKCASAQQAAAAQGSGVSGVGQVSQRETAKNAGPVRRQPRVGVSRAPAATLTKSGARARGGPEEKDAADGVTGKRRLEGGGAGAQEKPKGRQRRV